LALSPPLLLAAGGLGVSRLPAAPLRPWPRHWGEQEPLLERQHDRLEALLVALIAQHRQPLAHPLELPAVGELVEQARCRRLLWALRLHLRLEERWLAGAGVLCSGHMAHHREVARQAVIDFGRAAPCREDRLAWLQRLQAWFGAHRQGPDAMAYGLARQRQDP
jgi:hypothetical protein